MVHKIGSTVAAVVVIFNPDDRFKKLLLSVIEQVDKIWIINNQPNFDVDKFITNEQVECEDKTTDIENKRNIGLAAAQNQGIKLALADGLDWVLLLDQDSIPNKSFVKNMLHAAQTTVRFDSKDVFDLFFPPRPPYIV